MEVNKIKSIMYISSASLLLIPSLAVLVFDITLNSLFGNLTILISFLLFVLAKVITIIEKKRDKQNYSTDVGIIFGVLTAIAVIFLK